MVLASGGDWLSSNYIFQLNNATAELKASGPQLLYTQGSPQAKKHGWQARATAIMKPPPHGFEMHLRRRLDRWRVELLPGRRVARAINLLEVLAPRVPPRVIAVTIRSLCNGWVTARRMQGNAPCILNCRLGHDGLEHYCNCHIYIHIYK